MKNKGKAILFCRVSTQRQKHMLKAYENELREIAKKDGYSDENIKVISGVETASKKSMNKRKIIADLKEQITQGNIAVVYCADMTRFTRIIEDSEELFNYLKENSVKFVTFYSNGKTKDRIDFFGENDDGDIEKWKQLIQFAEDESNSNSTRVKRYRKQAIEEGKHHLGSPVIRGYYADENDHYQINENEAALLRRIYTEIIVFYKNLMDIAKELFEEGYFDDDDYDIEKIRQVIYHWVKNISITGKNNYPQIISYNLYELLQQRLEETTFGRSLLSGILCDRNGRKYVRTNSGSSPDRAHARYQIQYEKIQSFSQEMADEIVWDSVKEHFTEYYEHTIKQNGEFFFSPFNEEDFSYKNLWNYWLKDILAREKRKKKTQKKRVNKTIKQLKEKLNNGEITADEYRDKLNQINSEQAAKSNEIKARQKRISGFLSSIDSGPDFDSLDLNEKRVILLLCVNRVIAERENVEGKKREFWTVLTIIFKQGESKTVKFNYRKPGEIIILDKAPLPLPPPKK